VFEFQLTSEDMEVLDGLNRNLCYFFSSSTVGHPDYSFSEEY
ncbi:aldo-keto reductase family 1 member C2 isoform 3, partial [Daubentonia madagascariensis]